MVLVRPANREDLPAAAALLERYMAELFQRRWSGSLEALERDGLGSRFSLVVAAAGADADQLVGFAGWAPSYDLHHCLSGGMLMDLFVVPERRGRGVALQLAAAVCAAIHERGGHFVQGQAVGADSTRALYERVAMAFPGADCIVGGRAFRTFAELSGRRARDILRGMPPKAWNFEP